jgi:hypothetical protein
VAEKKLKGLRQSFFLLAVVNLTEKGIWPTTIWPNILA